jgi:hypothetical protein
VLVLFIGACTTHKQAIVSQEINLCNNLPMIALEKSNTLPKITLCVDSAKHDQWISTCNSSFLLKANKKTPSEKLDSVTIMIEGAFDSINNK